MRLPVLNAAAVLSLAAVACADVLDVDDSLGDAASVVSSVAKSATGAVARATFTPTALKAPFLEQFTDDWEDRWRVSHAKKQKDQSSEEEWAYVGTWSVEEPTVFNGIEGDKGLVIKDRAAHHAISSKFSKPINNKDKTLVVQYEVKLQNGLECGGAYMKLLQDNKALHAEEFSNASPYIIMFGPDKCGSTNKVHFIFRHKNPKTGEYEEKHLKSPPLARISKLSALYTLIVRPDQSFELKLDGESVKNGTLLEDFSPPVNPSKEIDDPDDKKPEDWVDKARIADPAATKPEDWDEDAPFEVPDEEAAKPANWLEDEPLTVPDPEAEKPEDWDDEEDGDWIAPSVPNPKCDEISGCGPWKRPSKSNPAYKGKWEADQIENPDYKGPWSPKKISNPKYYEDKKPANFEPMGAIGFEIWTMQNDILFDNIYIGHSVEDAEKLAEATFHVKRPIEKALEDAEVPKAEAKKPASSEGEASFKEDPLQFVKNKVDMFVTIAQRDPLRAIQLVPEVAGGLGVLLVTAIALIVSALSIGSSSAPSKAQVKETVKTAVDKTAKAATDAKNKTQEAIATGADRVDAEVNKRATRSSIAS